MDNKLDQNFQYKFSTKTVIESIKWFKQHIFALKGDKEFEQKQKNLLNSDENVVKRFEAGKMYLFNYDPKTKSSLPYYDTFPLILLTDIKGPMFYGINLHYLPVEHRMVFLSNITPQKAAYNKDGGIDRLNIKYTSLKGVQEFAFFQPCFKCYLKSNVRSRIKLIPAEDWGFAAALPVETFIKASKQQVWKDSLATQDMTI